MRKFLLALAVILLLHPCTAFATESTIEDEESPTLTEIVKLDVKESSRLKITITSGDVKKVKIDKKVIPEYSKGEPYYEIKVPYGLHDLTIVYQGDLDYNIEKERLDINPYLSAEKIEIIDGFGAKLSVVNPNSIISYKSRNPAIAAVSSTGDIQSIAPGSTVIDVQCGSVSMVCEVAVIPNVFTTDKLTMKECIAYTTTSRIHKVVYDGDYVKVTYRICNNSPATVTSKKVTIKLHDAFGKTIVDKTFKKQSCSLTPYSINDYTVKIKCKDLFVLNNAKTAISIKYTYA